MDEHELRRRVNTAAWSGGDAVVRVKKSDCPITITQPIYLKDVIIMGPNPHSVACFPGTNKETFRILLRDKSPFVCTGSNTGLIGCTIIYPDQNDPNNIIPYPPTILSTTQSSTSKTTVAHCTLVNPYHGIAIGRGRFDLHHIYMQALKVGISVHQSMDVGFMRHIHIWPFWSPTTLDPMRHQTKGIIMFKADWFDLDQIFCYGLYMGIQIAKNSYGTACGTIGSYQADACFIALDISALDQGGIMIDSIRLASAGLHGSGKAMAIHSHHSVDLSNSGVLMIGMMHIHGPWINSTHHWPHNQTKLKIGQLYQNKG